MCDSIAAAAGDVGNPVQGGTVATRCLLPHVKAGKLKALAIACARHSIGLPEVKEVAEPVDRNIEFQFPYVATAQRKAAA